MKIRAIFSSVLTVLTLNACDSQIEDLTSQRLTSNVPTTESNGVVTAGIKSDAGSDQVLVASAESNAAESSVTFPPGALMFSSDIAIGEATNQSAAIMGELGVNGLVETGSPVYIGPSAAGTTVDVAQNLVIQLPIPLEKFDNSARLADGESKLVLIYTIFNNGWKSGLIPLTKENLLGAFLKVELKGLGYFQVAYLAVAATGKDAASSLRPALGTNADSDNK